MKEGDTVTPGTVVASVAKGAVSSKSSEAPVKATPAKVAVELKEEAKPVVVPPPPPKVTVSPPVSRLLSQATEPKLPPKANERRVCNK